MDAPVIRISIGRFDPEQAAVVEARLRSSKENLENGIRAMKGNLAYYVGIDRANHVIHNVSVWRTIADATQMASFAPMLALAAEFTTLGVRFEQPILNFDTLWQLD